jgi:hypothetical protein
MWSGVLPERLGRPLGANSTASVALWRLGAVESSRDALDRIAGKGWRLKSVGRRGAGPRSQIGPGRGDLGRLGVPIARNSEIGPCDCDLGLAAVQLPSRRGPMTTAGEDRDARATPRWCQIAPPVCDAPPRRVSSPLIRQIAGSCSDLSPTRGWSQAARRVSGSQAGLRQPGRARVLSAGTGPGSHLAPLTPRGHPTAYHQVIPRRTTRSSHGVPPVRPTAYHQFAPPRPTGIRLTRQVITRKRQTP